MFRHQKTSYYKRIKKSSQFSTSEVSYNRINIRKIKLRTLLNLGYTIIEKDNKIKYSVQEKLFLFSSIFTFPLLLHMFYLKIQYYMVIVQFIICTPVFVCRLFFGKSSKSIKVNIKYGCSYNIRKYY